MDDQNLEKIIKERRKQARKLDLVEQVGLIAAYFGKYSQEYNPDSFTEIGYRTFRYKEMDIVSVQRLSGMSSGSSSQVYLRGKKCRERRLVFCGYANERNYHDPGIDTIIAYIPGDWERHLPDLYRKAVAKMEKEETKLKLEIERDLREDTFKRWGV